MSTRFFVETPVVDPQVVLEGEEAHHLARVMRAAVGDRVKLFDGSGAEFVGRIERLERSRVWLRVEERLVDNRELPIDLTIAAALPKGDRQRWLVEKLVELGTTRLLPLETERGVAQPTSQALARLRRAVVEASKQCGRNRLMAVAAPTGIEVLAGTAPHALRWLAHPAGVAARLPVTAAAEVLVAVGPEGGFTPSEAALLGDRGWQAVSFGPRILRSETAAVVAAALWSCTAAATAASASPPISAPPPPAS